MLLGAVLLAGRPATPEAAGAQPPEIERLATVRAKVTAIDLKKRLVTLKGPEGAPLTVEVGEEVRNLPQVKVGDEVVVRFYEALALEIKKAGKAKVGLTETVKTDRAKPGQRPAGVVATQVKANLEVLVVNRGDDSVTLKGPAGHVRWVKVKDPDLKPYLKTLKVGDIVAITYTEALAVSVEPAKGR
jgi:hypothetical protein